MSSVLPKFVVTHIYVHFILKKCQRRVKIILFETKNILFYFF